MAAAAYMSCSRIYNDYDGITHDYTREKGLVWEKIFLPENAPSMFFNSKIAIAKKLGEQLPDLEKHLAEQEAKRQAVPKPSWMRGRTKKKDNREER